MINNIHVFEDKLQSSKHAIVHTCIESFINLNYIILINVPEPLFHDTFDCGRFVEFRSKALKMPSGEFIIFLQCFPSVFPIFCSPIPKFDIHHCQPRRHEWIRNLHDDYPKVPLHGDFNTPLVNWWVMTEDAPSFDALFHEAC